MDEPPQDERRSSRFLLGLLAILVVMSLALVWPFLTGTIFAIVIGLMLQGAMRRLVRVVRARWLAAALLLVVVIAIAVVPLTFVGIQLFQEARGLVERAAEGGYDGQVLSTLTSLGMSEERARQLVTDILAQGGTLLRATAVPTLTALGSFAVNLGVFVFVLYFVLVGGDELLAVVRRAMPLADARREHLMTTVGQRIRVLFMGTFLVALIQGVAGALGWWFFGFPNPVFWGFVMTILAVIPAVGPSLIMLPAGIFALLQGDTFGGGGLIVWALVVVGLIDNIARPYIVGRGTGVHPALVLLGTLGGLALFGPTGFLLGPLILSMVEPILDEWQGLRAPSPAS